MFNLNIQATSFIIYSFFSIYFASDKKYYYSCENSKKYIYAKCDCTQNLYVEQIHANASVSISKYLKNI